MCFLLTLDGNKVIFDVLPNILFVKVLIVALWLSPLFQEQRMLIYINANLPWADSGI